MYFAIESKYLAYKYLATCNLNNRFETFYSGLKVFPELKVYAPIIRCSSDEWW